MATLQELKKKHKGIKSTEKLTKAMKTISAAKYSKLNRAYGGFSCFSEAGFSLYKKYEAEINALLPRAQKDAPPALLVFSSNKGMCGGFNTEIFSFLSEKRKELPENTVLIPCGKKAVAYFSEKKQNFAKSYIFSDTPTSEESEMLLNELLSMRKNGEISSVYVIYPSYKNVMKQIPVMKELFTAGSFSEEHSEDDIIFVPDKDTVLSAVVSKVLSASVYSVVLETALGAQAATLTTMRSAYDTAVKYSQILEIQINRKRQSEVTADVIETAQA